jgi:aryl-alcohol dehydrogenase-like predicted oxidoreductase
LGHSEEVVGKTLRERSDRPYIFTKCARIWGDDRRIGKCLQAASVRRECEASLRRLGVDTIDLYQIHWPEPDEELEEGWSTLARLQQEGKVRWIGVSNFSLSHLRRVQAIAPVTSLQPPYSAASPEVEAEILPYCLTAGIGVIVYSPMKSGLLTGAMTRERIAHLPPDDFRRNAPAFQEPLLTRNLQLAGLMGEIGRPRGLSAGEVAIAWTLRHPAVTGAIVGLRSAAQLAGVRRAAVERLTPDEIARIDAFLRTPA